MCERFNSRPLLYCEHKACFNAVKRIDIADYARTHIPTDTSGEKEKTRSSAETICKRPALLTF